MVMFTQDAKQALLWVEDGYTGRGYEFRKWELGATREITYRFVSQDDAAFIDELQKAIDLDPYLDDEAKTAFSTGLDNTTAMPWYQKDAITSLLNSSNIASMLDVTFREVDDDSAQITFSNAPTIVGKDGNPPMGKPPISLERTRVVISSSNTP